MIKSFPFILTFILLSICNDADTKKCTKVDFKYVYTECNENTQWRVQVPKIDCQGDQVEFPKPGIMCNRTCNPGTFLNIRTDACEPCGDGHYSLGSGRRFDSWEQLPPGFRVSTELIPESGTNVTCHGAQWKPMREFLAAMPTPGCMLNLLYTVRLTTAGYVSFDYQFHSSDVVFSFDVQNERCENVAMQSRTPWLDATERGATGHREVELQTGMNLLRWTVIAQPGGDQPQYPVMLHSVQVTGLPFVRSCSRCPAGWRSAAGREKCERCPRDHYSASGSRCVACPSDEFAPPASAGCRKRRSCSERDSEEFYTDCEAGSGFTTSLSRRWVQPRICRPDQWQLQRKTTERSCRRFCNPGTQPVAAANVSLGCSFCPGGQFSADTAGVCKQCPPATQVVQEYVVQNWVVVPPLVQLLCLPLRPDLNEACSGSGWSLMVDYIRSSASRQFAHRVLTLKLPGFVSPVSDLYNAEEHLSLFEIEFETVCSASCQLVLVQRQGQDRRTRRSIVKRWMHSQQRQNFTLTIRSSDPVKFYLVFDPDVSEDSKIREKAMHDHVKVFRLHATNVNGSGGVHCRHCPMGLKETKCIPCMPGHYFEASNTSCVRCPPNTVVSQRFAEGRNSCRPCQPGLFSQDGVTCGIDPLPVDAAGKHFNLGPLLSAGHTATGVRMFATQGAEYMHLYNVSLSVGRPAVCVSNATLERLHWLQVAGGGSADSPRQLEAFVCRSTLVPSLNGHSPLSALTASLGDRLLNSSRSSEAPQAQRLLQRAGWLPDTEGYDTHVFFETDRTTAACPHRRTTIVTLRCDTSVDSPRLQLPPKCQDGTCDGCLFHFMLLSPAACPLCRREEFDRVKGECVWGKQTVTLYAPKHCFLSSTRPQKLTETLACPLISWPMLLVLCSTAASGMASLLLACHCYRKNKTLQYKYTQLVEAKEGDMPGAESCAVHEGEEEEEEVTVKRGKATFSKLRRTILPAGESRGKTGEQQLSLTEQMEDLEL